MTNLEETILVDLHLLLGENLVQPLTGALGTQSTEWMNNFNYHLGDIPANLMDSKAGQHQIRDYLAWMLEKAC